MAITINGSGTITGISTGGLPDGIVDDGTLASSAVTSTKIADGTITNSDINASAAIAASKLTGTGKVLQVVNSVYGSTESTTSSGYVASGWSFSITPSSTNSKVHINLSAILAATKGGNCVARLYRSIGGGADTHVSGATSTHASTSNYNGFITTGYIPNDTHEENTIHNLSGSYLDNPVTTSTITYKLYYRARSGKTAYINRCSNSNSGTDSAYVYGVSTATLTEIGV